MVSPRINKQTIWGWCLPFSYDEGLNMVYHCNISLQPTVRKVTISYWTTEEVMIHTLLKLGGHEASIKSQVCHSRNWANLLAGIALSDTRPAPVAKEMPGIRFTFHRAPGTGQLPCPASRLPWQLPCRAAGWGSAELCGGAAARGTGAAARCGTLPCSDHGVDAERSLGPIGDV